MAASYAIKGNSFVAEKERQWSPKSLVNLVGSVRNFDLSPDGKRIAALMPGRQNGRSRCCLSCHLPSQFVRRTGTAGSREEIRLEHRVWVAVGDTPT